VSSFVAKPFNEQELKAKIEQAFGIAPQAPQAAPLAAAERLTADGRVRLRMAHIQITDHLVLGVLKHLIAKGELKPKTFEIETQCLPGWNPVQDALEAGSVDGACVLAPIAMDLFGFGAPIRLVLLAHKSGSIFVRNKMGAFKPPFADFFRGKSFYIPHKLSIHHMLAHLFFEQIGLKPGLAGQDGKDVFFEVVAPIKMQEFLQGNPEAGGFMVAEPLGTRAIASGAAELQFLSSELWENHPCCVVAMQQAFIDAYPEAVHEFVEMLVEAGQYIERKPESAAEIGVAFLDPEKKLGLKVPILKNVLTEARGIKTGDLYPDLEALKRMHAYMHGRMGVGAALELERFVDLRFAEKAYRRHNRTALASRLHDSDRTALVILERSAEGGSGDAKSRLNLEGKYLTFSLHGQEFGLDILKVREIVGMQPTRPLPRMPADIRGVINLRGQVVPVLNLAARFGMSDFQPGERNCIVVLETAGPRGRMTMGLAVESVSDVAPIKSADIEPSPFGGRWAAAAPILAMAKTGKTGVKLLLDIDRVLGTAPGV
jgi:chemotaxis signal transduction protein/ABC-type nitrate/sulfonate/bicarbonate transport system substrate-binding protein